MLFWPASSPRCSILPAPVRFETTLIPSQRLLILALSSHAFIVVLITLLLPGWRGVALAWQVVLLGILQWRRRFAEHSAALITGIRYDANGWSCRSGAAENAAWHRAQLLSPVFCHRHLLILRFRRVGHWLPEAVAITHDSCDACEFRRLRVLARHLPAPQLWAASR